MKRKDLLKTIITDTQSAPLPDFWSRNLSLPINSKKIITLTGVRRSGKTYHLFNIIKQLRNNKIPLESILYLNFEDERLDLKIEELDLIIQSYNELFPDINLSNCYFLFDEIQEVPGWEKFITRLYNSVTQNIFITGSNSSLLSQDIASALRGRTISFEIYPFSFYEYANIKAPKINPMTSKGKTKLVNLFIQFIYCGGFPELIEQTEELRNKILQEYFNVMVFKDLIERYNISQTAILKYFCKRVVANSAGEFSVNKIYNELKSQGYKISKDTLYDYQNYTEAIYLNRFIPKYSSSIVKSELSQKKSYIIDQGMGAALDYKLNLDKGRLLENTVCMELFKYGKDISYIQNGTECDFIVKEKNEEIEAIQVTQDLSNESTKNREIKGLILTCKKFNLSNGIILTLDQENELEIDGIKVQIIPAWKYFYHK